MDLPTSLNKSRSDLERLHKNDLVAMLLDSNAFILQHLLNENTMLKEQLRVLVSSTSAQTQSIDDLTDRIGSVETEIWRKDISARQLTVNNNAAERLRAQSMDTGMMRMKQVQQQRKLKQQKSVGFRGVPE